MRLKVDHALRSLREKLVGEGRFVTGNIGLDSEAGVLPGWISTNPQIPMRDSYSLGELLVPSGQAFVEGAYLAILRRRPDPEGLRSNLALLRSGEATKIEVLGHLRWSKEGLEHSVHVDGLLLPYTLGRWKRKRIVGPVLQWAMALVQLGQYPARAQRQEAASAEEIYALGSIINAISQQAQLRLLRVEELARFQAREGRRRNEQMTAHVAHTAAMVASLGADIRQHLGDELQQARGQLESVEAQIGGRLRDLEASLARLRGPELDLDAMYVAFEEQFRGPVALIRERALPYIDIMRSAGAGTADAPVIDLGCGRGDWLELLREHGMQARGVDSNAVFVDLCRARGLDVTLGDVMEVLRSMPDASVGAVTGMHIVEHLPFEVMIEMLDHCFRVLRPGGVIALETPNPENAWVGAHLFYMDPTHRNPIPPPTLQWLVGSRGFSDVRIERWTVARDLGAPAFVDAGVAGAASLNALVSQLHIAPDYAVIGRRAP